MYLTVHNQLTLLHDLLEEQSMYKSVSLTEYKQMKRLIQTMISNKHIDKKLIDMLPEIYYYSLKGELAQSHLDHILENEENIRKWVSTISSVKQHIS